VLKIPKTLEQASDLFEHMSNQMEKEEPSRKLCEAGGITLKKCPA
jgi:hypothetical protein